MTLAKSEVHIYNVFAPCALRGPGWTISQVQCCLGRAGSGDGGGEGPLAGAVGVGVGPRSADVHVLQVGDFVGQALQL